MKDDIKKNTVDEVSKMLRGVPPKNILISFGDEPARPLDEVAKEQQAKRSQRKKQEDRER